MKNSKRIQRITKNLEEIKEALNFYTQNSEEFDNKIQEIVDFIEERGLDSKKRDARIAKRLKKHWELNEKGDTEDI